LFTEIGVVQHHIYAALCINYGSSTRPCINNIG